MAINSNYIYTAVKILEDRRFDNIDVVSFKKLCEAYIENKSYGSYSKISNLEIIIDSLDDKKLMPGMERLLKIIFFTKIKKNL